MKLKALVAEFIGTFALLFAGVGSSVMMAFTFPNEPKSGASLLVVALAHGLVIAACGSALGHISGGHFNPAVSLGLAISKKLDFLTMIGYWIAQIAGAVVGTFLVKMTLESPGVGDLFDTAQGGLPQVNGYMEPTNALILEAIGTFFLVLVVLGTAVDKRGPKVGAWFIGMTITTMIITFGPMTGCGINPARWFGPAMVRAFFENAHVYLAGPLIGAALAAFIYSYFLAPEVKEADPAPEPA